ncbi:MAG: N-acetyltransferase [Chloroflexi bacterium]|nr:N-acetyltransferase [Chloroflexota bacterium]
MFIHPTAEVEAGAEIGPETRIWHLCQIRRGATIGSHCVIGRGVFVDVDVEIGDNVKIQNYVSVFHGVTIANGVFVGPHVCFTNDLLPRAVNPDMGLKAADDWTLTRTYVNDGASIGANATIVCGVTVGRWAMIGAGSVVTKDVPDFGLVVGNPAKLIGYVCACAMRHATEEAARSCTQCNSRPDQV